MDVDYWSIDAFEDWKTLTLFEIFSARTSFSMYLINACLSYGHSELAVDSRNSCIGVLVHDFMFVVAVCYSSGFSEFSRMMERAESSQKLYTSMRLWEFPDQYVTEPTDGSSGSFLAISRNDGSMNLIGGLIFLSVMSIWICVLSAVYCWVFNGRSFTWWLFLFLFFFQTNFQNATLLKFLEVRLFLVWLGC